MRITNGLPSKKAFRVIPVALLPFSLLQVVARHYPDFHPDLMDGFRGLLLGVVLGVLILKPGARIGRV